MTATRIDRGSVIVAAMRLAFVTIVAIVVSAPVALAEPYFAVREGMTCGSCHVNITGGGKRTELVNTHVNDLLHISRVFGPASRPREYFTGEINEYLGLGANLRTDYTAIFQDRADANGQVDNDKVVRDRLERNDLNTAAYLYAEVRLIPGHLTLYVDQDVINTDTREAFALVQGVLPWNGFIKAGQMFLPYGLQLQDDRAFIRQDTFNFNARETGLQVGFEPEPVTLIASVSNGPAGDRDVRFTGTAYTLFTDVPVVRNVLLGSSFSRVGSRTGDQNVFGFFAGTNIERLTVLGEVDFRDDAGRRGHFVAFAEANYLLFDWLNFKTAFDYADSDRVGSTFVDDAKNRLSFGLEPFINRFLQTRLFYRFSNGIRSLPERNRGELMAEAHLFF